MDELSMLFLSEAVKPIAKEAGERLADLVNLICTPIEVARKYKYIKMDDFFSRMDEKLKSKPEDQIVFPPLHIVGPALEDVAKYYGDSEHCKEMFSNLIASSMDINKTDMAHPSFIKIIEQMSELDSALLINLMKLYTNENDADQKLISDRIMFVLSLSLATELYRPSNAEDSGHWIYTFRYYLIDYDAHPARVTESIANLQRLGLILLEKQNELNDDYFNDIKRKHENCPELQPQALPHITLDKYIVRPTNTGRLFACTCFDFDKLGTPLNIIN